MESWQELLEIERQKDYMLELESFLTNERARCTVYPPKDKVLRALELTPLDKVRVVLLGQDPYIKEGQAEGLAFSVPDGTKIPPSLRNIFKLLKIDLGVERTSTSLTSWAEQGMLLLNTTLTVEAGRSLSHANKGWEIFTDNIIKVLNAQKAPILFVLWGGNARAKKTLITNPIHEIIETVHPSPLSCYHGFFESKQFVLIEDFLRRHGYPIIDFS